MGGGSWNNDFYEERAKTRAANNVKVFQHDEDVRTGKVATALHELLDPSKLRNGVREARDSAEHPHSRPVLVELDVTGSMRTTPVTVQKSLPKLMTTILTSGALADPQICFVAIGDSQTDRVPLQVGQFESGLQMEDDISRFYLEGNGGGSGEEGYEMGLMFATRYTATDAWEKRKEKGYLFIVGDERAYDEATPHAIHKIFGGEMPSKGVPLSTLITEAKERYHTYFIIPGGTDGSAGETVFNYWTERLGAGHVLRLADVSQICNLIALTIGIVEGTAKPDALTSLTPAIKAAIDPVLAGTKTKVADAKKSGSKTARL
jgi:hypothetical protein